ncbi:MAG TPA: ABC transporter transmembrane domain-containing protein, partial [Steroidobacteraceae bacterium]
MSPRAGEHSFVEPKEALWLLSAFCTLYQKSLDSEALARECVPPIAADVLTRLADSIGFDASVIELRDSLPAPEELPLAVQVRSGDEVAWRLVLQVDATRALVASPGQSNPETLPLQEFQETLTRTAVRIRPKAPEAVDPDIAAIQRRPFGFRWFVPELLKHKNIWREVLAASLVLQILALAFPLFTQTIIDKVVVHRTESTLIALAAGMAVFVVFTAILSWIRQYLVLHTGNRVDAVLGRQVFEHLFKLPPVYFQHRPTGVIAARLQGIETIREFVSSAAVTLMLDLPFLFIFVAVMFWYSVRLTLIVLAILTVIVLASLLVAPLFQRRLNEQFLRAAANQAFVTEYVAGLETVKSLQLEPQLNRRYGDLLAAFLGSSFRTRQLGNTYGTLASGLEQLMSLLILAFG